MAEKNTYVDFELEDGTTVKLTLQFYRLYMLKNANKKASATNRNINLRNERYRIWAQRKQGMLLGIL